MELIRCFIAIELPEELKGRLKELEAQLRSKKSSEVKWVDPASMHLTLEFLGGVSEEKISQIGQELEQAARGIPCFQLATSELGAFPNQRRIRVVWLGVCGELDKLNRLQKNIADNMQKIGFAPEERAFSPHLTLARVREYATAEERQELAEKLGQAKFEPAFAFTVESVNLMRSQLRPTGAIYTCLKSVPLQG